MSLLRQGRHYIAVGVLQLVLDWGVFVLATALGVPVATGNVLARVSGAVLGFWLHGRWTFGEDGKARLGWPRALRFTAVWLLLTAASTWLVTAINAALGLQWAWLGKPLVEGVLALLAFFLWRHIVYR